MSEIEKGRWQLDDATVGGVLNHMPEIEKVMVVLRHAGATHERIGPVGSVQTQGSTIHLAGEVHTVQIDPTQVARLVLDTSSQMQGKCFPSVEFQDAEGEALFSVIAMDGAEAFVAAFDGQAKTAQEPKERQMPAMSKTPDDLSGDQGFILLDRLRNEGAEVEIRMDLPGRSQHWRGRIEDVKPAMGFANVMTGDFHLHLKAGAVAEWREDAEGYAAYDADGKATGLRVVRM